MSAEKVHPWIYVIIPVSIGHGDGTQALFAAFCKDCRMYFTQTIPWTKGTNNWQMTPSDLPREGCGLSEAAEGFSTLPGVDR